MGLHLIIYFFAATIFYAGDPVIKKNTTQVLSSYKSDPVLNSRLLLSDAAGSQKFRLPVIKELELRAGNRDLYFNDLFYGVRVSTNNFTERRQLKKLPALNADLYHSEYQLLLKESLMDRYELVMKYLEAQQMKFWMDSLLYWNQMKSEILIEAMDHGEKIEIKDLTNARENIYALTNDLHEWNTIMDNVLQKLKVQCKIPELDTLVENELVQIRELENRIQSKLQNEAVSLTELNRQSELNLLHQEILLEKAKNQNWGTFLQLNYEDNTDPFVYQERFAGRAGVSIPIRGNSNRKLNELQLQKMELEQKIAVSREITQTNYQLKTISLRNEIRNFVMEEENLSNNIFFRFLNSPSLLATIKATEIIELKIGLIKEKIHLEKSKWAILGSYIEFLYETDLISSNPLVNHLHRSGVTLD
ncbi:MAG: hypothetical protein KA251_05085 [Saprospiraceae bacterium]|nr:hypothetical protein [Candidatus Vicinibacter affinis]MBP6173781.1 hypothetical protein [Saprospiraceae bacterium]MBK7302366.1 hypothetical protein [Candidatus Vicinibacter affinis]MBK7695699.1 hypothetical protein [Candidatus Vicinibacter affinis]MBK7798325.1 hypothetical protein [Candidatus Vicinibacter affinis]